MKKIKFIPFYFDGNQYFGLLESPEDVQILLKVYDYETLRQCKSNFFSGARPAFGLYSEYKHEPTLGEWIDKNNLGIFFDIKDERKLKLDKITSK